MDTSAADADVTASAASAVLKRTIAMLGHGVLKANDKISMDQSKVKMRLIEIYHHSLIHSLHIHIQREMMVRTLRSPWP